MRDQDDRFTLADQVTHDPDQILNLLRRQHGGRLVKNEHLGVTIEHFQNFDALLHADRDVLNLGVRLDIEPVLLGQRLDALRSALQAKHDAGLRLHAQNNVFGHREVVHQFEVLVHHADPQLVGDIGVVNAHFFATDLDVPCVRLIQTEQNAHQCRLSGTVLAEQRMHLTLA